MTVKKLGRNENTPFYFETLVAGIGFLDLLDRNSVLSKIQVKPDRKDGEARRIEDLTKFYRDGSVEIIQIKHTEASDPISFSDLWIAKLTIAQVKSTGKKEGVNIFKFLKSWRVHRKNTKNVRLSIFTNRKPTADFASFLSDIQKLKKGKTKWKDFSKKYATQLQNIKTNCSKKPFINSTELKNFVSSFEFKEISGVEGLEEDISKKLNNFGISDEERIGDFIHKITKIFISNSIDIFPSNVEQLIFRLKTNLIQEIITPSNYIDRTELENKILNAIDLKKKDGGFVLLYAPSGSGKTILLSKLAEKNPDFLPYFCRIRPFEAVKGKVGYSNNERLRSSWFKADIIQRCYEFELLPMSVGLKDNPDYIDKTFSDALSILSHKASERKDKKIVIIVDALDQVDTDKHKGNSVLDAIPSVNYPGVVFLLSTWGEKYIPQSIKDLPESDKKPVKLEMYFSQNEIKSYFREDKVLLTNDQAALIKKKTNGLAISLLYLSKKIKQQNKLDEIIQDSSQYTEVFDWYTPIWNKLTFKERECLGYLCFHFARVNRKTLQDLMFKKLSIAEFNDLLNTVRHFLDISSGLIEPYHDSFRRFIVTKFKNESKLYNKKLVGYYSKNLNSQYSQRYLTKHMCAVGISTPYIKGIFNRLNKVDFIQSIIKSKLDDASKVEIGKIFIDYFYSINDIKNLVEYSIRISDIYPHIYDSDTFEKINIGSEKLIAEVENDLAMPPNDAPCQLKDWLFKRLSAGNVLAKRKDKKSLDLAHRFIDDGLFRISLNRELLWGKEDTGGNDFWHNADIYAESLVNANQYNRAILFFRRIKFEKPASSLSGFLSARLSKIHLQNLNLNKKETLKTLAKAPKIERLLTYMQMQRMGLVVSNKKDFKELLEQQSNEKYLYEGQVLDFAESLFINNVSNGSQRVFKLLKKFKINTPYWSHQHVYWGGSNSTRGSILRWLTLRKIYDGGFVMKDFYKKSLKETFKNSSSFKEAEYDNDNLIDILSIECDLGKNRLLVEKKMISWQDYWAFFEKILKLYKEKIDKIASNSGSYQSDDIIKLYPYRQSLVSLIEENLEIVGTHFPKKMFFVLSEVENILGVDYVMKDETLLETLISITAINTSKIKDKIEIYINKDLDIRQNEKSDNMTKSSNLRSLAVRAAHKGFQNIAEKAFELNLKYSRGLWNKGDQKFTNYIDSLRTQKISDFREALKRIEAVSGVIEGEWYWRLDFLESVAYTYFEEALRYHYEFTIRGEVNHNESLVRIIQSYIQSYPYSTKENILPILKLMDLKDEQASDFLDNIETSYSAVCNWCLDNKDYTVAHDIASDYVMFLNKDVEPAKRISSLKDLSLLLKKYPQLKLLDKHVQGLIDRLEREGYKETLKDSSTIHVKYDGIDFKKVTTAAKKGQIKSVIKALEKYKEKNLYFTSQLVAELVPILTFDHIKEVRVWALKNNVSINGIVLFAALLEKGALANNNAFIKTITSEIFSYIRNSERGYEISEIIKQLDKVDFPNKKSTIKKILLSSIHKLAGDSYYLPQLLMSSSEWIDRYFIELKEYSFPVWKEMLDRSMKLSLSKIK